MHYAEFAEDEVCRPGVAESRSTIGMNAAEQPLDVHQKAALLNAMKEYEANRWKFIGQKLGKPAKVSLSPRARAPSPLRLSAMPHRNQKSLTRASFVSCRRASNTLESTFRRPRLERAAYPLSGLAQGRIGRTHCTG